MTEDCMRRSVLIALSLAVAIAAARPSLADVQDPPEPGGQRVAYVIGPEDVLDIAVWDNTQLTRTVPVRPDGKISLPLLKWRPHSRQTGTATAGKSNQGTTTWAAVDNHLTAGKPSLLGSKQKPR